MRFGIITSLLWSRWGPFWRSLLETAGFDVVTAGSGALASHAPEDAATAELAFDVAVAEARALADCERILAPDLNPGLAGGDDGGRGGGQDPWIADFPAALAQAVPGLPPVSSVPAALDEDVERLALELLLPVLRDPILVRRAWDRSRNLAVAPRAAGVRWQLRPSELRTVGVVGPAWWMTDAVVDAVRAASDRDDEHVVAQHQLDPAALRAEGRRVDADLIDTDAEAVGAARLFGRRGSVTELRVVLDPSSGSDAWLLRRIEAATRKRVTVVDARDLADAAADDGRGDADRLHGAFRLLAPR